MKAAIENQYQRMTVGGFVKLITIRCLGWNCLILSLGVYAVVLERKQLANYQDKQILVMGNKSVHFKG